MVASRTARIAAPDALPLPLHFFPSLLNDSDLVLPLRARDSSGIQLLLLQRDRREQLLPLGQLALTRDRHE